MTTYNSSYDETIPFSDEAAQINLAASVEQTYTVPGTNSKRYQALFSYNASANVFVGYNVTAAAPGAGLSTTTNNLEFRPGKRFVKGGDVLHFVTSDAAGAQFGVSLRTLPG